jgi:hypothetical protein
VANPKEVENEHLASPEDVSRGRGRRRGREGGETIEEGIKQKVGIPGNELELNTINVEFFVIKKGLH